MLFSRLRKTNFFTLFCSEISFYVNIRVVDIAVIFPLALILPHSDIHSVSYDQITTHGSAQSCIPRSLKKIYFSTVFCLELDLGVFIKVVGAGVRFHSPLV